MTFKLKHSLKKHQLVHKAEFGHTCDYCGKKFKASGKQIHHPQSLVIHCYKIPFTALGQPDKPQTTSHRGTPLQVWPMQLDGARQLLLYPSQEEAQRAGEQSGHYQPGRQPSKTNAVYQVKIHNNLNWIQHLFLCWFTKFSATLWANKNRNPAFTCLPSKSSNPSRYEKCKIIEYNHEFVEINLIIMNSSNQIPQDLF